MSITSKDYCNKLRELGAKLASGDLEEYRLDMTQLAEMMEPDEFMKISKGTSYSRTIINRVPEVKAVGAIRIKVEEDTFAKYYVFTLNRDVRRKVITNDDLPKIESTWRRKFIKQLLQTQPRISDLKGERLEGAAIALERFAAMLNEMTKEEI